MKPFGFYYICLVLLLSCNSSTTYETITEDFCAKQTLLSPPPLSEQLSPLASKIDQSTGVLTLEEGDL
ncbi:MAG TPA: hypothetical protein DGG95_05265, partial [Cytophagales bacterium]|nr:hypothetical protein [Cytophagales bacterium]